MPKNILIVDDDRLNTALIKFGLKDKGYHVLEAKNGREGIALLQSERPDLVVLDIQMPEMSGFEFMNELKTLPWAGGIPVIILTSNDSMRDVFLSEGVKGYFVKPVDLLRLEAKIRECLR